MTEPIVRFVDLDGARTLLVQSGGWREEYANLIHEQQLTGLSLALRDEVNVDFLCRLPNLEVLVVTGDVRDLRAISHLQDLRTLTLNVPSRPKIPLDLASLPRLTDLGCYWNDGFSSLFDCAGLRNLFLFNPPDVDLSRIGTLTSLERLELSQGRKLRSTEGVDRLSRLRVLGLYGQSALTSLAGVRELQELDQLMIEGCRRIASLEEISGLRALRALKFADCGRVDSFEPLRGLAQLEEIYAWGSTQIADGKLDVLRGLPRLRIVALRSRREYEPSLDQLADDLGPAVDFGR